MGIAGATEAGATEMGAGATGIGMETAGVRVGTVGQWARATEIQGAEGTLGAIGMEGVEVCARSRQRWTARAAAPCWGDRRWDRKVGWGGA